MIGGNTFETADGTAVPLSGFDASELDQTDGQETAEYLGQLIAERNVRIKQVRTSYGRVVAEVWLDGESVVRALG